MLAVERKRRSGQLTPRKQPAPLGSRVKANTQRKMQGLWLDAASLPDPTQAQIAPIAGRTRRTLR